METVNDHYTGVTTEVPTLNESNGHEEDLNGRLQEADMRLNQSFGEDLHVSHAHWDHGNNTGHPILDIARRRPGGGILHQTQLLVYHTMRKYVDPLDAAIKNRRSVEGHIRIEAESDDLQRTLRDFTRSVPVGFIHGAPKRGLNVYLNLMAEMADEYGLSAGEIVLESGGRGIDRLIVPSPRTLNIQDKNNDGLYEIYQSKTHHPKGTRTSERIDDKETVQTLSFGIAEEHPWPRPLAWSLVQTSEVLLRLYESVANGWWRYGDPSLLVTEEYDVDANPATETSGSAEVPTSLITLKSTLEQVFQKRKKGKVADAYHATQGADVNAEVLGNVDNTLMRWFSDHNNVLSGKVVGQAQVPVWMFPEMQMSGEGMNSNRSENMTVMAAEAAGERNKLKVQLGKEVIDNFLVASGRAGEIGNYRLVTEEAAAIDEKIRAQTSLTKAKANDLHAQVVNRLYQDGERRHQGGQAEEYLERHGSYEERRL